MDNPADYAYRNSMWTLFWALAIGGLFEMFGAPDLWPAIAAGSVFIGIPAVALFLAFTGR